MKKNHFFRNVMVLFFSLGSLSAFAQTLKFEAEDATLNGLNVVTDQDGFSGTGFVAAFGNSGNYIEYTVSGVTAGRHDLTIRYATDGGCPLDLYINNVLVGQANMVSTGGWGAWTNHVDYATLTAGTNTIRYVKTSGGSWMNMDYLSLTVETPIAVTGIDLSPTTADVVVNAKKQLTATVSPVDAGNKTVIWSSSNTAVAEVSSTGLVTAIALGSATITATTEDGGFSAICEITVLADPNANFIITYTEGNEESPSVSNTDLLQTAQTERTFTGGSYFNQINVLTDGNSTDQDVIYTGSTLTYTLDTSTNPLGYDISGIDVLTRWADNGLINPNVSISYSLVGSPDDFVSLTTVRFTSTVGGSNPWTKSNIYNEGAKIRSGVAKIKFEFGAQPYNMTGYSEIDVFGVATSPGTGIKNIEKNVVIYGANNNIVVDLSSKIGSSLIKVVDASGSVVKSIQSKGSELLNINMPTNGVYLVLVQNGDKLSSKKVVLN